MPIKSKTCLFRRFFKLSGLFGSASLFYRDLNIRNKLLIIFLTMILIVCSISLLTLQITLNICNGMLYEESAQFLNLSSDNIENELSKIEKLTYNIVTDTSIQEYLTAIKNKPSSYDKYTAMKYVIERLMGYAVSEKNVSYIIFVDTQGVQYVAGNNAVKLPEEVKAEIEERVAKREGANIFIEPMEGIRSLFSAREIRSSRNLSLECLGTLIILIDMDKLVESSLTKSYGNVNLSVLSGNKNIYSTWDMPKEYTSWNLEIKGGYNIRKLGREKYFVAHIISETTNWVYIHFIPYHNAFKNITILRNAMLALFGILFLASVLVSIKMARNVTKPIENLILKMKRAEEGNFDVEDTEKPSGSYRMDEIGYLEKSFNVMLRKINNLIQENYIKQMAIKEVQYKALQAQINPHFLYNTLESVNCLAKINGQKAISMMVESLGNLLRISINNKENTVTIEEEMNLLEYYINIQKIRYEDRLDFSMNIKPEIRKCMIPKLTLQPIVENSINYGLENMLDVCKISVRAITEKDCIRIFVYDNGPGIEPELIDKIISGKIKPKGSGIGLMNIDQRIKILFGDDYGVTIESMQRHGTTVLIKLPGKEGA